MRKRKPIVITKTILSFIAVMMTFWWGITFAGESDRLAKAMQAGGHVLMIRHAYAPGTGDPGNFKIGDCTTQRNIDDRGRSQARQTGKWLRERGIDTARVYSSQWCRCLETARLMALGSVTELPALNSFFEKPEDREPNLAALRGFLSRQPAEGTLLVLVTHYVTILGITDEAVSSGEAVVLKLTGTGGFNVLGRMRF
jgi:phosphohistidine phosphatase SixA